METKKMLKKDLRYLIILFIVWNLVVVPFYYLSTPMIKAYNSYDYSCNIIPSLETLNETKLKNDGVRGYYDENTDTIKVLIDENHPDYQTVLKHELCHKNQERENRFYDCSNKFGAFLNELECYLEEK